jgi:hypothetical protein
MKNQLANLEAMSFEGMNVELLSDREQNEYAGGRSAPAPSINPISIVKTAPAPAITVCPLPGPGVFFFLIS